MSHPHSHVNYPPGADLLDFFGVEPLLDDDVVIYRTSDSTGAILAFSFRTCDDSVQTLLKIDGRQVSCVCHENLTRMWIQGSVLHGNFECNEYRITLELSLDPFIHIAWSGLRI